MGIFYAATSFAIAEVLPFGDASPATWMLAGLIFTAIIYAWLRRQHGHTKA